MRSIKIHAMIEKNILPVIAIIFLAAFFSVCSKRFRADLPEIAHEYGYADIREYNFETEVYNLVNNWDYYPGVLYAPENFKDEGSQPLPDNEAPIDVNLGTYRIRFLAKPNEWLSLCSFSLDFSTRVFVNGKEVRNIGYVSENPKEAVPKVRFMTIPMYSGGSGEIELIYQYSNFVHNDGGFVPATYISTPENIDEYQRRIALWSLLIGSGLLFLMFWFLLCASIQKSREYAALAFCCLVIALRNQFFFAEYLINPDYDFFWEYRVIVLDVSLIPASALYLLYAFFPKAIGKKTMYILMGVFAVLTAIHWVLDTRDLVGLCHVCYYCCALFLMWSIICLSKYFFREHKPDRTELISLGAVSLLIVMLIREGMATGSSQTINHFGITPFIMVICLMGLAVVINVRIQRQMFALEKTRQENRLLEQTNDMNRDFLRMVAHELKTPLTVISGYAQLTGRQMEKMKDNEKMLGHMETIRNEADRLGTIVTRLMDYTYNKPRNVEMTAVNVQELFDSAVSVMTPVCMKNENMLNVRNKNSSMIRGNRELLLQVLLNLISNACRYTEKGVISIETDEDQKCVIFTVTDTGRGIPPATIPHIFEKGYTTGEGRGLGLAICMESVQVHGGELKLNYTGSEGTSFCFTIPKWNG